MKVKTIVDEDFVNYRKPSMLIATAECDWKCCKEAGCDSSMCQNSPLANQPTIDIQESEIVKRYIKNPITSAIVIGGLEPLLQTAHIVKLVSLLRYYQCNDDIVIYTGYYKNEIDDFIKMISPYRNIVIKYGRYIPNSRHRVDDVLGVTLASDNQYAERIC